MRLRSILLLLSLGTAACNDADWQTRNITGLLPPLELRLSGTGQAPLTEADLAGGVTLLSFGFMSCPDVCPTTLSKLAETRHGLPTERAADVRIVFVSVDPERDDPIRLSEYVQYFDADMLGVTGTKAELQALARRYRITFSYGRPNRHGDYDVAHPAGVYVFDAKGRSRLLFRSADTVEAMRADLERLLAES